MTDNGLCVIQSISSEPPLSSDGLKEGKRYITLKVTSRLLHTSEQWFEDTISIPVEAEPQALGKVTTYIRRYALMALVGIAPEDDDGEDAAGRGNDLPDVKKVKAAQPGQEHWCAEHNCAFKEHRQGTEHWYSHKLADGKWCNEPSDNPKSSQDAQGTGDTKKAEELGGESKILKDWDIFIKAVKQVKWETGLREFIRSEFKIVAEKDDMKALFGRLTLKQQAVVAEALREKLKEFKESQEQETK